MANTDANKRLVIAIDGPAGSGKSTTARLVAGKLGYTYIDTGAMYRAVTLAALRKGISVSEKSAIEQVAETIEIHLRLSPETGTQRTLLNGEDVSTEIRSAEVTANVSTVSSYAGVRKRMVHMQRAIGKQGAVVMDGRDIGTVVFPEADIKVFMVADIAQRAHRRHAELETSEQNVSVDELAQSLAERDLLDSSRDVSPLTKATDAVEIDTSSITIEEQVEKVLQLVREHIGAPIG